MHATFKLFNRSSTATCFLLKDPPTDEVYLVTAAHVLSKAKGETSILVLRKTDADGRYQRLDQTIPIREGKKDLWTQHPELDIAAMRLTLPAGTLENSATLPLSALESPGLTYGGPVTILAYPKRVESNSAGFPVARQGIVASFPLRPADNPVFMIDFTAWDGDSGGPVVLAGPDGPAIAGLVISRIHHNETIETETEDRKVKHALDLGNALHSSLILDTIRQIPRAAPDTEEAPATAAP